MENAAINEATAVAAIQYNEDYSAPDVSVYLALCQDTDTLAAAVYDTRLASLQMLNASFTSSAVLSSVIERVHTQFDVDHVIISSRNAAGQGLLALLKSVHAKLGRSIAITVRKNTDFLYKRACTEIEQTTIRRLGSTFPDPNCAQNDILGSISTHLDLDNKPLIQASGGKHVVKVAHAMEYCNKFCESSFDPVGNQLERQATLCVSAIVYVPLEDVMQIGIGSLQALQIFNTESHPSQVKESGQGKEGLSLFGFLNRTITRAGSALLRQWMLAPLVNIPSINERLDVVGFLVSNGELLTSIRASLHDFADVSRIFSRIRSRSASPIDWYKFAASMATFTVIQSTIENASTQPDDSMTPKIIQSIHVAQSIRDLYALVGNVINFDESIADGCFVVHPGVSEALDAARVKYADLDNVLNEVAYQIQESNSSLTSITVQYIPQVGYVVCCDAPTTLPDFVFQFQEDDTTFYYKDPCCRDLDTSIGDIFGFVQDIQRDLLEELTLAILEHEPTIYDMIHQVAQLDCLGAFADTASSSNYVRPIVSDRNEFCVTQARHPLQELLVDQYIANDIRIDDSQPVMVVTGHNGSGKSVLLKTVGLLQFVSQIGSFVPAAEASIGVASKILTRIQRYRTPSLSSPLNFLAQLMDAAWSPPPFRTVHSHWTAPRCSRALYLIDEFGKGTADMDGAALLISTIRCFTASISPIRVVVTTHLLNDKNKSMLSNIEARSSGWDDGELEPSVRGQPCLVTMTRSIEETSAEVSRPLYELHSGLTLSSNAFGCAAACGIPEEVLLRSAQVLSRTRMGQSIPPCSTLMHDSPASETLINEFLSVDNWMSTSPANVASILRLMRMGTTMP